jgi:hypothetical protein
MEARADDAYVSSGKTPSPEWQPWPRDRLEALRVLRCATHAAMSDLAPDALVLDALAEVPTPLRCACESLFIQEIAPVRDSADPDLVAPLARARGWLAKPDGCRFDTARARWAHGDLMQLTDYQTLPAPMQFAIDLFPRRLSRSLRGATFLYVESWGPGGAYRSAREPPK